MPYSEGDVGVCVGSKSEEAVLMVECGGRQFCLSSSG